MKRNAEFEVCYYAIGTLKCHCKCVTVEVSTHKGSMTFEDFIILRGLFFYSGWYFRSPSRCGYKKY